MKDIHIWHWKQKNNKNYDYIIQYLKIKIVEKHFTYILLFAVLKNQKPVVYLLIITILNSPNKYRVV